MPLEILLSLAVFALVGSATPGPNNLMVLASGVNFGFRRTVPHMLGISFGFAALLLAVGFGLGALLEASPATFTALKFAGGSYLLYLAWRIATTRAIGDAKAGARPMSFVEAALFQWVNPKAWVFAIGGMATYAAGADNATSVLIVGLVFALISIPSLSTWTGFGTLLKAWLADPRRLRLFNGIMAILLVASLWPMLK